MNKLISNLDKLISKKFLLALLWIVPLVFVAGTTIRQSLVVPMWQDEYVFYRMTSELPHLSVTADWFFVDNPKTLIPSSNFPVDRVQLFHLIYDTPIYVHTPLANYLCYPFVAGVNLLIDKGIIPPIEAPSNGAETATTILRIIPIALFCASMFLIYKLLKRKVGNYAYLYSIPVIITLNLVGGVYYFYWDAFMWFFFILTLYLSERNSKWAYLTACLLVNTKVVIGMALLIPLIIKNWKMIFAGFSYLPFYLATVFITHDWLYLYSHMYAQTSQYSWLYMWWSNKILTNNGLITFGIITLPIFYYVKKYAVYVALFIIAIGYGFGFGISLEKISPLLYVGALIFPLVAYELHLIERGKKLLNLEGA